MRFSILSPAPQSLPPRHLLRGKGISSVKRRVLPKALVSTCAVQQAVLRTDARCRGSRAQVTTEQREKEERCWSLLTTIMMAGPSDSCALAGWQT